SCGFSRGGLQGKNDAKEAAFTESAFDFDAAAVATHDGFADRQSQSGAFADILGGEERIEHLGEVGGGDAAAVVGDLDKHLLVIAARGDGNPSMLPAAGLDGLDRIDQQV